MKHNIYFVCSLATMVIIAPFGAINPIISLIAVIIAGLFFAIWYKKEMESQKNEK